MHPTAPVYDNSFNGEQDQFAAIIDIDGSLVAATFFGGTRGDIASGIGFDNRGNIYFGGETDSADFPTTPDASQRTLRGVHDGTLVVLTPDLSQVLYATYIGGTDTDRVRSVSVDGGRNLFVAGDSRSTDFLTTSGAVQATNKGAQDYTLMKFALPQ
jgi:hypothetical protein